MSRLFLISVGGSGTRVVESLVHMLAMGGMSQQWPEEIHILIMEMDRGNGNLVRLDDLMKRYQALHDACASLEDQNRFFRPMIKTYYWHPESSDPLLRKTFNNLMDTDEDAQILGSLLYTEEELNMSIDNGFKGRPALGVAYFNQLSPLTAPETHEGIRGFFEALETPDPSDDVQPGELPRVLVISSCHGGTGATGIPALERQLHRHFSGKNLHLGLLLMLPTFSVPPATEDSDTPIESDTFTDKVKTVFSYYAKEGLFHEKANRGYRWTYLLGYQEPVPFSEYSEGSEKQNNPCTIFDWYATIAIRQFAAGQDRQEPAPGIYVSAIPPTPWDYRRFERVFPSITTDVTAMLHTALIFQRHLMPALDRLRGNPSRFGVETYAKKLSHLPYLHDFYPNDSALVRQEAIAETFAPLDDYTAFFIRWLYDVVCHAPTDYPEGMDSDAVIRFHRLPDDAREALREAFARKKPEYVRSLVRQQFVNAPYLHKAQMSLSNGLPFPERDEDDPGEFTDALCRMIEKIVKRLDDSDVFSVMTPQTGTPRVRTPYILGELSEHKPVGAVPPEDADESTWTLLMALLMTVQDHHPITGMGKPLNRPFMKGRERQHG